MSPLHRARLAAPLLLIAALSGCGKSALNAPQGDSNLTTQQANAFATQVGLLAVSTGLDVPAGSPATFARQRQAPAVRRNPALWDTTVTDPNGTLQMSVQFFDADGAEQSAYDAQTTARAHLASHMHVAFSDATGEFVLGSGSTLDLAGLLPSVDRQTASGARADTVHFSYADDTTSVDYTTRGTGQILDVVRLKPVDEGYPLSGSLRWTLYADVHIVATQGSVDQTLRGTAVLTFDGTRYATLVLNGRFRYTVDLDTGEATPLVS